MKPFAIILFSILSVNLFSQTTEDEKKFENLFAVEAETTHYHDQLKDNKNEVNFLFSLLFVMYKDVISSQDVDMCVFTPSCSVYAIESIKQKGIVAGYLSAIDRLTRCNPGRNKNLPIDPATGKYYDPVIPTEPISALLAAPKN